MATSIQRVLLALAVTTLFAGGILLDDGSNLISGVLKYVVFLSASAVAVWVSKPASNAPKVLFVPLALLCLIGLASALWSDNQQATMERAAFNIVIVGALYVVATRFARESQLLLIGDVGLIVSVMILLGCVPAYIFEWRQAYFMGNFKGSFYNANVLGHLIGMLGVPYAVTVALRGRSQFYVGLVLLSLLVFFQVESRSRAGVLSALISASYILLCVRKRLGALSRALLVFAVVAGIGLVAAHPGFLLSKWDDMGVASPLGTRAYLWRAHLDAIDRRPLFGWGLGVNPVSFRDYVPDNFVDTEKGSSYIALPEELGVPFAAIVLTSFVFFAMAVTKSVRQDLRGAGKALEALPVAIILSGLVHALFESWLFYFGNPMSLLFWLCCVYVAIPGRQLGRDERIPGSRSPENMCRGARKPIGLGARIA
jgi:O-antigen ligase